MSAPHRKSAFIGLMLWIVLLLALVGLFTFLYTNRDNEGLPAHVSEQKIISSIVLSLLSLMICFFWTSYHLAKAKGYSPALCLLGLLGPLAQFGTLAALLYMKDRNSRDPDQNRPKRQRSRGSQMERIVSLRRNAVLGIFFGLAGIAAGVFVVLFRIGLFRDRGNEICFGMLVFLAGYIGVIAGCRWWLKAKHWIDAIVFIGLMPLGILLIPYVRLIYLRAPMLLPAGMVFMPIVLLVVVAVLPDKSGWVGRKRWRIRQEDEG